MWLTNKLQWPPAQVGSVIAAPAPSKATEPWPQGERLFCPNRSCRTRSSAQHRSSLTPHSSFLSPTRAFISTLRMTPNFPGLLTTTLGFPYEGSPFPLPSCSCQIHHLFVLLPTDTKRLCWLRNRLGWIKVKETQDLATRTVLGTPDWFQKVSEATISSTNSIRDQSYQIP